ncbi:DNA mismatch repair protein msh6 [Coemansia biformis]|uniref:DNA mismatch repair protein n=1 Tax=Coemansia biformis TaxID=1286918 RepID=A0A9W7YER6_9FUNG|nr:DNA mismatch repair protein msh6 [Coemansia biformis]
MPQPQGSGTPKGARMQTSIFSFFATPPPSKAPRERKAPDSQDDLLDEVGALIDDDMLAEVVQVETTLALAERDRGCAASRPSAMPIGYKRKAAQMDVDGAEAGSADDLGECLSSDDDDDGDDDYTPEVVKAQGRSAGSRRRAAVDSDDDDDADTETDEAPPAPPSPPAPTQARPTPARGKKPGSGRSGALSSGGSLARMRFSTAGSSASSEGTPLASALGLPGTKVPSLSRANTSSESAPLLQRMQSKLQAPPTPTDAKRARATAFAKKNEERYAWLEDVRDAQQVRPDEPGYDKRTLYIPPDAWRQFSPFERQYWEIKSQHWDTVVFFKKGKFYELYENDATIAHQEFDLKLTDRVNMRMAGVPESSFDHWVAQFLAKGHKVARVDQMESRLAKDMRERGSSKKGDSLVVRELTGVLTAGTLVDPSLLTQDLATYCMAIVEAAREGAAADAGPGAASASFGIAFVDTATAQFHLCTIRDDDADRSGLETLLVQVNPREVVYVRGGAGPGRRAGPGLAAGALAKGNSVDGAELSGPDSWDGMAGISQGTWRTLKATCGPRTEWVALAPRTEFWDVPTAKREIGQAGYFGSGSWPPALQHALEHDALALTAAGGLLSYLRSLKLDADLVSLGNFAPYAPMQHGTALVLDGPTLSNLDIFTVSAEDSSNPVAAAAAAGGAGRVSGGAEGTLFSLLNQARTPFGRRLLSRWTCHPLQRPAAINARLDAVEFFLRDGDLGASLADALTGLPDLERGLSRIHSGRCKVPDFLAVLDGLEAAGALVDQLQRTHGDAAPARVGALLSALPALGGILSEFRAAFDAGLAASEGRLLPFPGSDQPYDDSMAAITALDEWFEQHLRENRKRFGCASIVYKSMGKEHYQLEMPASVAVPDSYFRLSATKAVSRYWSPELRAKAQERAEAVEMQSMVLDSYQSRLYARFDKHYSVAMKAVSVVAELDCLRALAAASGSLGAPACRPTILEDNGRCGGYVEFRQLRHPCVALSVGASSFVANDIVLGRRHATSNGGGGDGEDDPASMILLSGPNMGGKSTLLRQLCLGVLLAQLGCYVPAQSATIVPVDRLFTRIGARDNLLAGRSTFMVEMAETSTILRYATPRSLVVLDELGRGTSTHDGEAVAFGVLHGLCSRLGCLGFFSTHYGLLAESLLAPGAGRGAAVEPHLRPMYMACAVSEDEHRVTFLYRLQRGVASKSHGMNVAAMAGVPVSIVRRAAAAAERFEQGVKRRQQHIERGTDSGDAGAQLVPLTLQSDFANLLRMAALQGGGSSSSSSDGGGPAAGGHEAPIGGACRARQANENQYWSCIVDHMRRTIPHGQ